MSAFSISLSTCLFSGTYLQPSVAEAEGALRDELCRYLTDRPSSSEGSAGASIRFTLEPDRKLVLLDVCGKEQADRQALGDYLHEYRVRTGSVQPFVIYQLDLPAR